MTRTRKPYCVSAAHAASVAVLMLGQPYAMEARAEEARIPAHHVRLAGVGGDNAANRKNLLVMYRACVETQTAFGKPYQPLREDAIPGTIRASKVDIFYAANRTLTVTRGTAYDIDRTSCALLAIPHEKWTLQSSAGRCDADLLKKTAIGQCDMQAHARAPVAAHRKPLPEMSATPQVKTVADTACEVHANAAIQSELCIANPRSLVGNALNPYPIPPAPLNGGYPGVLIDAKTPALTLHAEQVEWNTAVAADALALPAGVHVKSFAVR
jgi:hypothetical protein